MENGTGKASTRAKNKYNAKTYDRVNLVLKKDTSPTKDQVQAAADAVGESLNSYIVGAISQRMQRDGAPASSTAEKDGENHA